jgi:flagellar M-ring protein FliF
MAAQDFAGLPLATPRSMDNALASPVNTLVPASPNFGQRLAALPTRSKLMAMVGLAALVVLMVMLTSGQRQGEFKVLFANLGERDGGPIIEKLAQMNVPYRVSDGSGTIMVPAAQVYELRLKLSAAGLPKGSINGYELLDKAPFGQTQGQEHLNHKRALEGELTRTIQSLSSVQTARVHLAMPQQNGFFREQQKPSASIVLTLHPGRTLDSAQIAGIVHLVSSSVPELAAKAVSVLDGSGSLLSQQGDTPAPQGLDAHQVQHLREVEATHLKRVLQLLEPVVGRDNVRATVSAELDFSQTESTSEEFKPNQGDAPAAVRAIRSEESSQPGSSTPSGVPGAVSNQPPATPTAPVNGAAQPLRAATPGNGGSSGGGAKREAETRYEVDKKVSVTRNATGVVRRLNAAVVVNHRSATDAKGKVTVTPLSAEEIEKLTALVQQGIGYNKERGDSVRVVNAPFHIDVQPTPEATPIWKEMWVQDLVRSAAMPLALAVMGLVLVLGVIRPALKPAFVAAKEETGQQLNEVVADEPELPALASSTPLSLAPPSTPTLDSVRALAKTNPAAVANVLRGWTNGDGA